MINIINKLKKELLEMSQENQVISDEIVQASQKLDNYIVNYMEMQLERKKDNSNYTGHTIKASG